MIRNESLLIGESLFKTLSPVAGTLDYDYVRPHVITAQDMRIQPVLGTNLYEALQDSIFTDTVSDEQKLLLEDYIAKAMVWHTLTEAMLFLLAKLSNSGIVQKSTAEEVGISFIDAKALKANAKVKAEFYTQRLIEYLIHNKSLFPQYSIVEDNDMPADTENTSCGFIFDDTLEAVASGDGGGGSMDHRVLTNRDAADQHPIDAITGLRAILDAVPDSLKLSNNPPTITVEGEIFWNNALHTIEYDTGLGKTITVGGTQYLVIFNDTIDVIPEFRAMHLKSAVSFNNELYPTFEYADPRVWSKVQGTIGITMQAIAPSSLGLLALSSQKISGGNTTTIPAGSQLWVATDGLGTLTGVKPSFPNFAVSVGGSYNSEVSGDIFVNITTSIDDIFNDAWDGAILESFDFRVSSDGTTVTGLLTNVDPSRTLTAKFSDNYFTIDTVTTPIDVVLTPGLDTLTQSNYVYIPKDTKVLTVSLQGWPVTEHCRIARIELQTAANVQVVGGARRNQNTNDHVKREDDNGHILHIAEWVRAQNATHESGVETTITGLPNGYLQVTAGSVRQLHVQTVDAISMPTSSLLIATDPDVAYREVSSLSEITKFSNGDTWNNKWGKITVWLVANKSGEPDFLMLNTPTGGETDSAKALADVSGKANYTIPNAYKGCAILLATFAINIVSGSVVYSGDFEDLRGFVPNNVAGGGVSGGVTTMLALEDVFAATYVGEAGKVLRVNTGETGMELVTLPTSAPTRELVQTPIQINTDAGTTDIPIDNTSKIFSILNAVSSQTFTVSGLSNVEESTCKRILDNSANAVAVTVTWATEFIWDDSGVPSGLAAGGKYILELEVQSTSEVFAMLIPL